jgi:hypothetical protein
MLSPPDRKEWINLVNMAENTNMKKPMLYLVLIDDYLGLKDKQMNLPIEQKKFRLYFTREVLISAMHKIVDDVRKAIVLHKELHG